MTGLAVIAAVVLTTMPVFVVLAWRWHRDLSAGEMALAVPLAVATDLLGVLVICRFARLELAVVIARGLWLAAALAIGIGRWRTPWTWPRALTPRRTATVVAAMALGVLLSIHISRPYAIFDRGWHIPLVASLRAQRIPFVNVFDPAAGLHYHYTGDVLAAVVQTLSGNVMHSSLALSVTHDVLFAETAASLALLFVHFAMRGAATVLAVLAVLLGGPVSLLLEGEKRPWSGYSILSFFQLSYRPHMAVAGLLFVGFLGAILVRLHAPRGSRPTSRTALALFASTAALAITDEASTGLLGLTIGAAWLVDADVLHRRRVVGAAMLVGLLACVVLPQLAFAASLAPGGQSHPMKLVPWRAPGFYTPVLPMTTAAGRWTLFADFLPVAAIWAAGVLLAVRSSCRHVRVSFLAYTCLAAASFFGVSRVDVDGAALESHRFAAVVVFAAPLLGAVWVAAAPHRLIARALVQVGLALAAASTLEWAVVVAPVMAKKPSDFHKPDDLHDFDCRDVGSSFGDRAELTYLDPGIWYLYAGCRPVFAPAARDARQNWELQTKNPLVGPPAFAELERLVGDRDMTVVCELGSGDAVCRKALAHPHCEPAGRRALRCQVQPDERR